MNLLVTIFTKDKRAPCYFVTGSNHILQGIATVMRECGELDNNVIAISVTNCEDRSIDKARLLKDNIVMLKATI